MSAALLSGRTRSRAAKGAAPPAAQTAGWAVGRVIVAVKETHTPRRLYALRTTIWGLALLLFFVGEGTLNRARSALKTIAKDTAPSILAAEDIRVALADLDTNLANTLLGTVGQRSDAAQAIERRRIEVSEALVRAAASISYGDAERVPIQGMVLDLGRYFERVAEARLEQSLGDDARAKDAFWAATDVLHNKLLKEADALNDANKSELDAAYHKQWLAAEGAEGLAAFVGCLLLGALAWAQLFLFKRMRRVLNPPLVLATALAFWFAWYLIGRFSDARSDLHIVKQDAFDSIYVLTKARSIAADTKGDESRWLLDLTPAGWNPARGSEEAFRRNVTALTSQPKVTGVVESEMVRLGAGGHNPTYTGLFWEELGNLTFAGEADTATTMIGAFSAYHDIDERIRALERSGKHAEAVELSIGTRPDGSKAAFDRFDQAVLATIAINQRAFDDAAADGDRGLRHAEWADPAFTIAIALLAWLGFRPRLREYAV